MSFKSFYNVFNRLAVIRENKATQMYENKFAGELIKAVMDSGTARICIERRSSYIFGNGFVDEVLATKKANASQTFNKLLAAIAPQVATFKTVCLKVLVDNKGEIYRVYNMPVDKVERSATGKFLYNRTKNTDTYDRNEDEYFKEFNPLATPAQRLAQLQEELKINKGVQKGTLVYVFNESLGQPYYSIPPAYSGIEDIETDAQLSKFELENLLNGFMPSAMLTLIGNVDDTIQDEKTGKTERDKLNENLKKFTGKGEGRAKLLVNNAETKEAAPILQQFDMSYVLDALDGITDRSGRKVCRLFEVPPVLAGFEDASILGSNQTFKNALVGLQHSVIKDQELIIEALNIIYPEQDFTIKQLQLIDYIPTEVLAKLTDDELRALAGYEPIPSDIDTSTKTLSEIIGVGGTQSMVSILESTTMTNTQKRNLLKLLFNLTDEDANNLVPESQILNVK